MVRTLIQLSVGQRGGPRHNCYPLRVALRLLFKAFAERTALHLSVFSTTHTMCVRVIKYLQNLHGFFRRNQFQLTQLRIRVRRHRFGQTNKVACHPFHGFPLIQRGCILQSELDACLFLTGLHHQIKLDWRLF
ncbi:hypothetical protein D3C74_283350 [compost metagenome]